MKFAHKKLETLRYHVANTGVSISSGLGSIPGRVTRSDEWKDRQTNGQAELR